MNNFEFLPLDKLLKEKYKASVIDKWTFRDILYGKGRNDYVSVSEMTEDIIQTENAVFYLINDVDVINKNCICLYSYMYPNEEHLPTTSSGFCPFILFVVGLSEDGTHVEDYARWGSFGDNIFDEMGKLGLI